MKFNSFSYRWQILQNKIIPVCTINNKDYFIGIHVAKILNKESFNLYRSLKTRKYIVHHLRHNAVLPFIESKIVKNGTQRITLLLVEDVIAYFQEILNGKQQSLIYYHNTDEYIANIICSMKVNDRSSI